MNEIFEGFQESKKRFSSLPDQFFSELLPAIDDINELKLTIYLLWNAYTQGDFGTAFHLADVLLDQRFLDGLQSEGAEIEAVVAQAMEKAAARGSLIEAADPDNGEALYFINSPRGRQAAALLDRSGEVLAQTDVKPTLDSIQPNIFQLYEENIGTLTPLIADALRDAQENCPEEWIAEAIQLAVKNNVRRWKYVESILTRWQEEGKDGANRRDDQEDHRRYIKGEYGEIGQH
jgi:DnaD/phage-associated family protein